MKACLENGNLIALVGNNPEEKKQCLFTGLLSVLKSLAGNKHTEVPLDLFYGAEKFIGRILKQYICVDRIFFFCLRLLLQHFIIAFQVHPEQCP